MYKYLVCLYLLVINLISGILFAYDKFAATTNRRRVSEQTLHTFESLGGVFANLLFMYILRHKTVKPSYYKWTWLILTGWIFIVLILIQTFFLK
jgi:uncharacterized membrane protein YsdA (DUF1294 family)